jgi:hypothetical protein
MKTRETSNGRPPTAWASAIAELAHIRVRSQKSPATPDTLQRMSDGGSPKPGLKKVAEVEFWESRPAMLYLDDIEEIYGLFGSLPGKIQLRLDGYELSSFEDTAQLKTTETRDFRISAYWEGTLVSFEATYRGFRFVTSNRDKLPTIGLRDAVKRVVQRRKLWVPSFWRLSLPLWIVVAIGWFVPRGPLAVLSTAVLFFAFAVYLVAMATAIRNESRRSGKVILRDSHTLQSFRKANRDVFLVLMTIAGTLAVTVVATVVGGIILYALGFVGKR